MGGVIGVSTMTVWDGVEMSRYCRVTYPGQHQCRAQYMIFSAFVISKTYMYYIFQPVYVLLKGTLMVSSVILAQHC